MFIIQKKQEKKMEIIKRENKQIPNDPYRFVKEIEVAVGSFYREYGYYPEKIYVPIDLIQNAQNTFLGDTLKEFYYQDYVRIIPDKEIKDFILVAPEFN